METKKILGTAVAALAVGAAGGIALAPANEVVVDKIVEVEKIVNQTVEVPVEVVRYDVLEVPVDNGNLETVLEHIFDNDGKVDYLTDDLDDDEVEQIVDRVVFMNEVKSLAVDAIKDELFDELDKEVFTRANNSTVELDEDDLERLRVDDDDDEISVEEVDFEDRDAEVKLTGTFEQDDEEFEFEAIVEFKDGEFDEVKDIVISQ